MKNTFLNKIICADALTVLDKIAESSIDIVLTDPPYFLDKLDNNWSSSKINNNKPNKHTKCM